MFVLKTLKPPNVERNLAEQNLSTKAVYELPFKVTMENKLRCFQYKVIHNILPTNSNLYKMKLRTSPSCDRCSHPHENLFHLLYDCPSTQVFWQRVISWWNEKRSENVILSALDILYGYKSESNIFQALNHYVTIAKYHIFLSWLNKTSPSFEIFSLLLNEKILCERTIAFKNNTLRKFRAKWEALCAWAAPNIFVLGDVPLLLLLLFSFFYLYFGVRDSSIDLESNLCKLQHCK